MPLNHIGCCIQILANLSKYASIKLHFNNWKLLFDDKYKVHFNFQCVLIQLQIFLQNKNRKSNTLKFAKLIICMQQMQYSAPHRSYVFQTFFWCWDPESGPLPFKIPAARLAIFKHVEQAGDAGEKAKQGVSQ